MHGDTEMVIGYSTLQVRNAQGEHLGIGIIFQDLTLVMRQKSEKPKAARPDAP
jgi:hypothetical protein